MNITIYNKWPQFAGPPISLPWRYLSFTSAYRVFDGDCSRRLGCLVTPAARHLVLVNAISYQGFSGHEIARGCGYSPVPGCRSGLVARLNRHTSPVRNLIRDDPRRGIRVMQVDAAAPCQH